MMEDSTNTLAVRLKEILPSDHNHPNGIEASSASRGSIKPVRHPNCIELDSECRADPNKIVTFLIEENSLLREGLRRILSDTAYRPVALASSLDEIGSIPASEDATSIVIMDATRDHEEACRQAKLLKDDIRTIRVVMLVEQYSLKEVLAAFQSGADAYLLKSISCEALVKVLDLVLLGEPVFPARILGSLRDGAVPVDLEQSKVLSSRELTIVRCLMDGDSNKVIARKLNIAEATVKVHVKAILRKIRVKNRTQAAVWGTSHLLLDDDASVPEAVAA